MKMMTEQASPRIMKLLGITNLLKRRDQVITESMEGRY